MRALSIVACLVVLASACGGGGGTSKEEFIDEADAICADANREVAALGPNPARPKPLAAHVTKVHAIVVRRLQELRGLERPEGDEDEIEQILGRFEAAASGLAETVGALQRGMPARVPELTRQTASAAIEGQRLANAYGLRACARFGAR